MDTGFHTGLPITFTGRAEFDPAVDTPLNVIALWMSPVDLTTDERVSIKGPELVEASPIVYESNYSVLLEMGRDNGSYTLSLDISSVPYTTGIMDSVTRNITVTGIETT